MTIYLTLFAAGILTILLPCILPLLPIVLGVSVAGHSRWRPLLIVAGMLVSFIGFTFLLIVVLDQFVVLADVIRIATYAILLLFGTAFLSEKRAVRQLGVVAGSLFFLSYGWLVVLIALLAGSALMEAGGWVASRLQQVGSDIQGEARSVFGADSSLTTLVIGLTLGLIWVPCAGPALGFAFTLVREQPGLQAFLALLAYGLGTAVPLLLVGYGGQWAVHSVRSLARSSGYIKRVAGVLLILTAIALQLRLFGK